MNFIDADKIRELLRYEHLIPAIERVLASFSSKENNICQPVRSIVSFPRHNGLMCSMPALIEDQDALANKIFTVYPDNVDFPKVQSYVLYFDPSNGTLLSMMEGKAITAIRTAAASAVATKYLSPPDTSILCVLGAGVQAKSHIEALSVLHKYHEVRIYNRTKQNAEQIAKHFPNVKVCDSAEEAVRGADVINLTLFYDGPVLFADWVKPGAHINSIGVHRTICEVDPKLMTSAVVYVDTLDGARQESADIILSKPDIYGEIGEVVLGSKEARFKETTIFKSMGIACEDTIAAKLIWDSICENQQ